VQEALEEDYLRYRIASTAYLGDHIASHGVPIVQPPAATPSTSTPAPSSRTFLLISFRV
jgi:hypothetical protein